MKTSLASSGLILLAALVLHYRWSQELHSLQVILKSQRAAVRKLQLGPSTNPTGQNKGLNNKPVGAIGARSADSIRQIATELIGLATSIQKHEARGGMASDNRQAITHMLGLIASLSSTELVDLADAIDKETEENKPMKEELIYFTLTMMADGNPIAAFEVYAKYNGHLKVGKASRILETIAESLIKKDSKAALAFIEDPANQGVFTSKHLAQAIGSLAEQNPEAAVSRLTDLESADQDIASSILGSSLEPGDREHILKLTENLPKDVRKSLLHGVGSALFRGVASESIQWLETATLDSAERTIITDHIFRNFMQASSPDKWLNYLGRAETDPAALKRYANSVVSDWTQKDFNAVGEWLNSTPPSPIYEEALLTFVKTLAIHEPEAAAVWAEKLPHSPEREKLMNNIQSTRK